MSTVLHWCVAVILASTLCMFSTVVADEAAKPPRFKFSQESEPSLTLYEGDKKVLVYNHGMIASSTARGSRPRACYIHPLFGLDGETLTDDFPKDHLYHRGVFWAWTHITLGDTEYDLWSNKGDMRQTFVRWLKQEAAADRASLGVENAWRVQDKTLVREQLWLDVYPADEQSRAIDVRLVWTPVGQSLTLSGAEGKSYGGFNVRFGPRQKTVITVPEKSTLPEGVTAEAGRTSGDLLMTPLTWVDMCGDFATEGNLNDGKLSGAAIFVHPQHRDYPPTWMTRHYGLISVGWPGVKAQTFPADQPIECRYRLWIHRGHPTASEIEAAYNTYRNSNP